MGRLLGTTGRVLPMALTPMDITAEVRGLDPADPEARQTVRGQVAVATTDGEIVSVALDPADPEACPEAVEAVRDADWVVLGPGSWFTSVIPHLMVPALREALGQTTPAWSSYSTWRRRRGRPVGSGRRTTWPPCSSTHPGSRCTPSWSTPAASRRSTTSNAAVASYGARLVVDDVALGDGTPRHDPEKLASAYAAIFEEG